jgi:hypothetical protein
MKTKKQKLKEEIELKNKALIFRDRIFDIFCPNMRSHIKNPKDLEAFIDSFFLKYEENFDNKTLKFELHSQDVNFEHLFDMATLLKTKKINFSEKRVQWGYSEYTQGTDIFKVFYCSEVLFNENEKI